LLDPANPPWNNGISITSDYRFDYQSLEFPDTTCSLSPGNYLKYDGNFYNCLSGLDTKFQRKITISDGPVSGDSLNIKVEVSWQEKGRPQKVEAQENLYNWKQ